MGQAQPESWSSTDRGVPQIRNNPLFLSSEPTLASSAFMGRSRGDSALRFPSFTSPPFQSISKFLPKSFDFCLKCHDINSDNLHCVLKLHCELPGKSPSWISSLTTMTTIASKRCHCLHLTEMRHQQDQSLAQGHTEIDAEPGIILKVFLSSFIMKCSCI